MTQATTQIAQKRRKPQLKYAEMTASVQTLDRHRDGLDLAGSLSGFGDTGAAALVERLSTVLEDGEEMPDVRHLFRLLERLARRDVEALDAVDEKRWVEGMCLLQLQQDSRRARVELYEVMVEVRKTLVGLYGSDFCRRRFGLASRTPRGAENLVIEALRLSRRLRRPDFELPTLATPGLTVDPSALAAMLEPGARHLLELLDEIERRQRGSREHVARRRRALESFDARYLALARTAEALLMLGGQQELAKRVRSTSKQRKRSAATARAKRRARTAVAAVVERPQRAVEALASTAVSKATSKIVRIAGWLRGRRGRSEDFSGLTGGTQVSSGSKPRRQRWHGAFEGVETSLPALARVSLER